MTMPDDQAGATSARPARAARVSMPTRPMTDSEWRQFLERAGVLPRRQPPHMQQRWCPRCKQFVWFSVRWQ